MPVSTPDRPLVIATRESRLALWQARHVQARLERLGHRVQLLGMTTLGDQILDRSLSKVGGKGLFVKELESALADGRADLAVHSLKDVPMTLPPGFSLACVMAREDPRDALVGPSGGELAALPQGAVVGTSSLRRQLLLREHFERIGRQDLRIAPLRGNLDTRLRKLDEGGYGAIVLAAAGLVRLELGARIARRFSCDEMLPAAGQGALGIEVRSDRPELIAQLQALADRPTALATAAERSVSRELGGSCSMPLAAHARWQDGQLRIDAAWGEVDEGPLASHPVRVLRAQRTGMVQDEPQAEALGCEVARALLAAGARRIPA